MNKVQQGEGRVSFVTCSFLITRINIATWDKTFRLTTTHVWRLLEYLWRPAVRAGRIFIDPLCLPRRRCRVRVSISSAEITIFIHKLRLERAHRAHNKARGLPDQLTLLHLLRAANLNFGNTTRGKITSRDTKCLRFAMIYILFPWYFHLR